jgi:hypothetical protein
MNMSKSNMSYGVRSLIASRMVTKLEEKRERKELYAADTPEEERLACRRDLDKLKHAAGYVTLSPFRRQSGVQQQIFILVSSRLSIGLSQLLWLPGPRLEFFGVFKRTYDSLFSQ